MSGFFSLKVFKVHPCCSLNLFLRLNDILLLDIPCVFSSLDGLFDYLHFLAIMNKAAVKIHGHVFVGTYALRLQP